LLKRLAINVSHDCNLRRTYCYADTGAYGAPRMKLSNPVGIDHRCG
jgi:molybdenum cofactor biosynthesis enzyme MoaA